MKTYYGNYLGLVINDKDPDQRGRVKVFIPHIMPSLYEDWNKEGEDISFNITDSGLPTGLNPNVIKRLEKILPWAECAAPIFGAGPAGIYNNSTGTLDRAALNRGNGAFDQYKQGVVGQGGKVVFDSQGDTFEIDTSLQKPGNTLGTVNEILLHDTGGTSIGFLNSRPGGTYNYIVYNGKVYTTTPEGTASTYGALGRNSNSIHIAWVGPFSGVPNDTDLKLLTQVTSYVANKYGLSKSDIKTHGAVQANKKGDAEGWADLMLSRLTTDGGTPEENPSGERSLTADKNSKSDPTTETGSIKDEGSDEDFDGAPEIAEGKVLPNALDGQIDVPVEDTSTGARVSTRFTAYSPQRGGSNVAGSGGEGGYESSRVGLDGQAVVRTLQDVASGNSSYVTLAGDPSTYGQRYTIPTVTFTNSSGQTQTLTNVLGYVHDTGSAFTGAGTSKFDLAVDRDLSQSEINSQPFLANNGSVTLTAADDATVAAAKNAPVINSPADSGTTFVNTNYLPTGMFGSARTGQMVWVFFQEGDPLFPVYFAASYGKNEWANVNQHASKNKAKLVKTKDNSEEDPLQGSQVTLSLNAGGFKDTQLISGQPSGFEKDEFAFQVYGKNGSNLSFTFHTTYLNSKYDFRQHTQGDAHYITGGNREDRVTGDFNTFCEQDVVVTIGNWSAKALQAAADIQQVVDQAMKAAKDTYEA
jgi:hypothetical protein